MPSIHAASQAPNQFVDVAGRRLAYRVLGDGIPMVLCLRFRGVMDDWDPASLARDTLDLIGALELDKVVLCGWSIGGVAAQLVHLQAPQRLSHLVLIGTTPPGQLVKTAEPLFYELAARENDFEDFVHLFFEPASDASRDAAARSAARIAERTDGRCTPVPHAWAAAFLGEGPRNPAFPLDIALDALKRTTIPILHIGGDHDIIFPVENWYALNRSLPTLTLLTYPSAGHGPQLQHPEASARHIAAFVKG